MNRGFTLVETLAVVAILALVTSMLAVGLGGAAQASAWQRASAQVRHFDRLARLDARANGPMQICVAEAGACVIAQRVGTAPVVSRTPQFESFGFSKTGPADAGAGAPGFTLMSASGDLQTGASARLSVSPLANATIDSAGRSVDFVYRICDGVRAVRIHVAGFTGFTWEEPE